MTLNSLDDDLTQRLRAALPDDILRDVEPRYLSEPRDSWPGQAGLVALPRSVDEVAAVVRVAGELRIGIIPYGGGTGLVSGQVMPKGPLLLVLSLERMNKVRAVFPEENVLIAEAGVILADVQAAAEEAGRLFPLSLASEGSCRVGGVLGTNAGGVNVLRYGNARDLCLGLEAVLPDGTIWNGLTRLRKDNTGYDLRNLLVGAEGTLGVITAATLKLVPVPAETGTALLHVASPAAALSLLSLARDQLGEGVSAFELMHRTGFEFLSEALPDLRQPWAQAPEWSVLIDVGLARGLDPQAALADLFEAAAEHELADDGLIAQSRGQAVDFWNMREHIPEANRKIGSIVSNDIALPLGEVAEFIDRAPGALAALGDFRINCFGHLGDGNLHYNIFPQRGATRADYAGVAGDVKRVVHDLVQEMGGSFSAEHGVGRAKVGDLERYGDPARLAAMRAIKAALDPLGIMNPGAVLA
ncbi:MAG: hydroxyacid dehydrogenase [Pseudooceanicola sp.]|jgi:FAD/FMN-containing dehydrogenase|nr:hydroxyacid dehydrogenase [Pseudooceanicola sp.]